MWPLTRSFRQYGFDPRKRRALGNTLLETVVVFGILSLAGVLLFALFSLGTRYLREGENRSDLYRPILMVARDLKSLAAQAPTSGVGFLYSGGSAEGGDLAIAIPVIRTETGQTQVDQGTGEPLYQGHAVFYRKGDLLREHRVPMTPTIEPTPLTGVEIEAIVAADEGQPVVKGVEFFALLDSSGSPSPALNQNTEFEIRAESSDAQSARFTSLLHFLR